MSYDDIVSALFTSPAGVVAPSVPASPARRLRDALEPIATQGWWPREPNEALAALGLGFFDGYILGRAASLGQPVAALVDATFGVFAPGLVGGLHQHAASVAARDDVLAAREAGAVTSLGRVVDEATAAGIADPLLAALDQLDAMGRPLFASLRALPRPGSAVRRLWRAAELVREHRGDGHLAAAVAMGLGAAELNVLTELWLGYSLGEYSATRGMDGEAIAGGVARLEARGWLGDGRLTDAGRAAREELEAATDRSQGALVELLGDGLGTVVDGAARVSEALVATASFPPDPRKRSAG